MHGKLNATQTRDLNCVLAIIYVRNIARPPNNVHGSMHPLHHPGIQQKNFQRLYEDEKASTLLVDLFEHSS